MKGVMKMFIELTDTQTNSGILININHIISVESTGSRCVINTIIHNQGFSIYVSEGYSEVKALLNT